MNLGRGKDLLYFAEEILPLVAMPTLHAPCSDILLGNFWLPSRQVPLVKVCGPFMVTFRDWTSHHFEWCVVRFGCKNAYNKDMCLKKTLDYLLTVY